MLTINQNVCFQVNCLLFGRKLYVALHLIFCYWREIFVSVMYHRLLRAKWPLLLHPLHHSQLLCRNRNQKRKCQRVTLCQRPPQHILLLLVKTRYARCIFSFDLIFFEQKITLSSSRLGKGGLLILGSGTPLAILGIFDIFEKTSPKKLNCPKNSRIFQAKTQRISSDDSQVSFKTHSIIWVFLL